MTEEADGTISHSPLKCYQGWMS